MNTDDEIPEFERELVELGSSTSPTDVLAQLRRGKPVTPRFLYGGDTCESFTLGRFLGKGKSGTVFEIDEDEHKGLPVVLKEFTAKEPPEIRRMEDGTLLYVLSSSMNDVVMSSIFHSFYNGGLHHCITFPYFEGFFTCGSTGYSIIEKLDKTLSSYIGSRDFDVDVFKAMLFQVFYAVKFMVSRKVVHNDLHAKNIMTRTTEGIAYRGVPLDDVDHFAFVDGENTYYQENYGILAKIMDFDFAASYSNPHIGPEKIYRLRDDEWNLRFRYTTSYDFLVFAAYMAYYVVLKTPGGGKISRDDLLEARELITQVADYIVGEAERQVGKIRRMDHYKKESTGKKRDRDSVAKLMDMVSVPQYRPYEKYCQLDLSGILEIDAFAEYRKQPPSSLIISSM